MANFTITEGYLASYCIFLCKFFCIDIPEDGQPSPCFNQLGPSSPQSKVRTCLNPLCHLRQPLGARLATSLGLWVKSRLTPLHMPRWQTPVYHQDCILIRRPFLLEAHVTLASSWLGCGRLFLMAQLKGEKLIVVPTTANELRLAFSELRSLDGRRVWVSIFSRSRRTAVCSYWWRNCVGEYLRASIARISNSWTFASRESCAPIRPSRPGTHQGTPSHTSLILSVARGPEPSKVRSITELYGLRVLVERGRKSAATGHPAAPKARQARSSDNQMDLSEGWNHVATGSVSSRPPTIHHEIQIPIPSQPRRRKSSIKWPPPRRVPGLRSLSSSLQQPLSPLLGSPRRKQPR